jgi:hypothetical protein
MEEHGRCKEHYLEYLLNLQAVLYVGGGMSVPHILLQNLRKKTHLKNQKINFISLYSTL